ncbi:MAG: ATP-binding protein [Pseudomonadota bacterium]
MSLKERLYHSLLGHMKLKPKLVLGMSFILIIVMAMFTYFDVVYHQESFLEQTEKMISEITDTVVKSIEYPMLDGEMEQVQAILERLRALEDLDVVHLCNPEGIIRYSGESSNIGRVTASEITLRALRTGELVKGMEIRRIKVPKGEKVLRYAIPIPNEPTCFKCHGSDDELLGILTVGYLWDPIEKMVVFHRNRDVLFFFIAVLAVGFFLTKWLTTSVTKPISLLTNWADEISRGNLDAHFDLRRQVHCWEAEECTKIKCPAHGREDVRCWYVDGTLCTGKPMGEFPEKLDECRECEVYKQYAGDEIVQLADAFSYMARQQKKYMDELGQMYENNLQSERLASIGRGVAHISHEIKNPLVVIGGFTRQVSRDLAPDSKAQKKLEIVINEIQRLEDLLVEISDLTRLSGPQKSFGDINKIVEDVYVLMASEFKKHHIEVNSCRQSSLPLLYFDPRQIKQVLINVVKNSIEAMPDGGKLVCETELRDSMLHLRILDTGKGIHPDKLPDIFDSFVTTKPKGTGLGLAISLKIIRDHGGTMEFESESGKGTTCIISLPLNAEEKNETESINAET